MTILVWKFWIEGQRPKY